MSSRPPRQPPYWPASTGSLILSIIFANKLWITDATSMSLYWVARLPIKRPKNWRKSVLAEAGAPVYDADAVVHVPYEGEGAPAIEAAFPGTTANGKVRISSKTSPAAPIGRLRQWKIALSLAVVGALGAPFAFGTYKARPTHLVWVPLTAHEKEQRANYLDTDDCKSFDDDRIDIGERYFCDLGNEKGTPQYFKRWMKEQLEKGGSEERHVDLSMYWMMNIGVATATAVSLFGLAYLIPMLIRGVAFLARRYWRWLNA